MAKQFLAEVTEMRGVKGTSEVHLLFTDGSVLSFHAVAGDPRPRGTGGIVSWAKKFYDSVTGFDLSPKGVEFIFKDDSLVSLDLGGATATHTAH